MKYTLAFACLLAAVCYASPAAGQVIDDSPTRVQTTLAPGLKRLGTLRPKNIHQLGNSRWTLGCETIDREYSDYHRFKEYLPPLGIGRIRLQVGWARTEKDPGIYDFAWLDSIVDDARARGLEIWLETSYGNPAYPGAGGRTLNDGFPSTPAGLAAWDHWIEVLAAHYKGRVRDWSMWNEPDGNEDQTPQQITEFNIRTAEILRRVIPDARIGALVLCGPKPEFIEPFMKILSERGKLGLFEWVVYHGYARNPDDQYPAVARAEAAVRKYSPTMKLRQGEAGTLSEYSPVGALNLYPWTELTQAKWLARRMLGDAARGLESEVFTAADLDYRTTSFHNGLVRYGLIKMSGAADGFRVLKVKTAYYAVQNVVSVFNDALAPLPDFDGRVQCAKPAAVYGFKDAATGLPVCAFWDKSAIPSDRNTTLTATLTLGGPAFTDPVWVDTITGGVYEIPREMMRVEGKRMTFTGLPLYDAPAFITDKRLLSFAPVVQ